MSALYILTVMKSQLTKRVWTRSQVEHALWRHIVTHKDWGTDPNKLVDRMPQVFRSRVKKLLNLDRIPDMTPWPDLLKDIWAFYDGPPQGTGSEERFSTVHVFVLGIALDLLNVGLKQSEVIFFVKHAREFLEKALIEIHNETDWIAPVHRTTRQLSLHRDHPKSSPIFLEQKSQPFADFTAWMIVQRIENQEIFPLLKEKKRDPNSPLFMNPEFIVGLEGLKERLFRRGSSYRHGIFIELADSALTLPEYLAEAPTVRRGRPVEHGRKN